MNGDEQDQAEKAYTIQIPGMTDVFRIPLDPEYNRRLQVERIRRLKERYSPLPEKLQWIPTVITKLDDAEDLLSVALTLAKPLLRRLPARFIPGLGWILLGLDILNFSILIMGMLTTGPRMKAVAREADDIFRVSRAWRIRRVERWLSRTSWFGFALEAGQVLESLTGYGLSLGSIMGFMSDAMWGGIRALQGKQVRFVGPPPSDPLGKAYRYMSTSHVIPFLSDEVDNAGMNMMLAAENVARTIIRTQANPEILNERAPAAEETEVPVFEPWDPVSRAALLENGIDPEGPIRPPWYGDEPNPRYIDIYNQVADMESEFTWYRREAYGPTDEGTIAKMLYHEAGEQSMDIIHGEEGILEPAYSDVEIVTQKTIEYGIYPPDGTPKDQFEIYAGYVMRASRADGEMYPTMERLIEWAIWMWGGYQTTPTVW